jgi:hypothetical protein
LHFLGTEHYHDQLDTTHDHAPIHDELDTEHAHAQFDTSCDHTPPNDEIATKHAHVAFQCNNYQISAESAHAHTVHGLTPLSSHNDHDANDVKSRIQKLQPTYLTCYNWTSRMTLFLKG